MPRTDGDQVKLPTLTQIAKGTADFVRYRTGELWYSLEWWDDEVELYKRMEFPIPLDDAGNGDFIPQMKGMAVLRWARKEVERQDAQERLNERLKSEWAAKLAENGGAEG